MSLICGKLIVGRVLSRSPSYGTTSICCSTTQKSEYYWIHWGMVSL